MFKFSLGLLVVLIIVVFTLPLIITTSAYTLNPQAILLSPSFEHIMGTDRLGRDLFTRILVGGQTSLIIGFLAATITSFIGLIIGISAGYFKGNTDKTITILIDLFLTFPTFFLLLALVSYMEASISILIIVLVVTGWMGMARLIRSESFAISNKPFIKILNLAKVSKTKIILKYFAPLLAPIFLVSFTFGVGGAILAESGLSFLGLGINPPQISWGSLLSDGKEVLEIAWWVSFFPGLCIFIVTFCLMQMANKLQSKLNEKEF
ncbi:MAG: ABC transporter permease [Epsilonproteobacteria bacterium]|nr:MAG: ABC transporter permease [Campylobacterota bacterium]